VAEAVAYRIRVRGELDQKWVAWFDGMSVQPAGDGTTLLIGPVPDQPALYGLIERARDLGLELISVQAGGERG
jgi:hypothetical protein